MIVADHEIINLGLRPYLMHKWVDYSLRFYHEDVQLIKRQNLAELSVNSVVAASEVGATGYVIFLGMKVLSLSVGEIVMYSRAFAQGLNSLRQGVGDITGMYEELLFLSNLIEFHRLKPHTKVKKKTTPLPGEIESIFVLFDKNRIIFKFHTLAVSFEYHFHMNLSGQHVFLFLPLLKTTHYGAFSSREPGPGQAFEHNIFNAVLPAVLSLLGLVAVLIYCVDVGL